MAKVQILLSVYDPDWVTFTKQLTSLENQDFDDIEILIHDDGYEKAPVDQERIRKILIKKKVAFLPPTKNLGFAKAFERLLAASTAPVIAFCDQDDIWREDKIRKCVDLLQSTDYKVVCSDQEIIDINDQTIRETNLRSSVQDAFPWKSGDDIARQDLILTSCVGMAIAGDGDFCRAALPFPEAAAHDQWLIACAAKDHKLALIEEPLVKYRRHANNVSGTLKGVNTKQDYYEKRIMPSCVMIDEFVRRFPDYYGSRQLAAVSEARKKRQIGNLLKNSALNRSVLGFEAVMKLCPGFLFPIMVKTAQKMTG